MSSWKDLLATANTKQTLKRARSALGKKTVYALGRGGINPLKPLTKECDCSGFVAWAIGIPRELPPGSDHWLQTTTYWQGDKGHFDPVAKDETLSGDLYVYPDLDGKQGHIGIITSTKNGAPEKILHCSSGNYRRTGDAIQETSPAVFAAHPKARIMRIDYSALRGSFGLAEPDPESAEEPTPPIPAIVLKSPLLAANQGLQEVAAGRLILTPDGHLSSSAAALHDAFKLLSQEDRAYRIDLGAGDRQRGYFGKKTERAVKAFQKRHGLPETGIIDRPTLAHLDTELRSLEKPDRPSAPEPLSPACDKIEVATLKQRIYLGRGKTRDETVPIYELPGRSGYFYRAKMSVDVDGAPHAYHPTDDKKALDYLANATTHSKTYVQGRNGIGPAPGYYVSATSLQKGPANDCGSYVDAEAIPYFVFPAKFRDVKIGDCGIIANLRNGLITHAIFADTNPRVGEASYKAALDLKVSNPSPKNGGDSKSNYVYLIFPGSRFVPDSVPPRWPRDKIKSIAAERFEAWGGIAQLRACYPEFPLSA